MSRDGVWDWWCRDRAARRRLVVDPSSRDAITARADEPSLVDVEVASSVGYAMINVQIQPDVVVTLDNPSRQNARHAQSHIYR